METQIEYMLEVQEQIEALKIALGAVLQKVTEQAAHIKALEERYGGHYHFGDAVMDASKPNYLAL